MSKPVIVLNELTKSYGKHRGIENISFTVEQGEVFGFIGPNGAGKAMESTGGLRKSALRLSVLRYSALSAPTGRENLLPSAP